MTEDVSLCPQKCVYWPAANAEGRARATTVRRFLAGEFGRYFLLLFLFDIVGSISCVCSSLRLAVVPSAFPPG